MEENKFKALALDLYKNLITALMLVRSALMERELAWDSFKNQSLAPKTLVLKYFLPIAGVGALATVIGQSIVGFSTPLGTIRVPFFYALFSSIALIVVQVAILIVASIAISKLSASETFGKTVSFEKTFGWLCYVMLISATASILAFVPYLSALASLVLGLFALYFMWLGTSRYLEQDEKRLPFFAVSIVLTIIVSIVLMLTHSMFFSWQPPVENSLQLNIENNQELKKSLEELLQK